MAETFSELVQILNSQNKVSISLDGNRKHILIGPYYDFGGLEYEGPDDPIAWSSQKGGSKNPQRSTEGLPETIKMVSTSKNIQPINLSINLEYRVRIKGDSGDILIKNEDGKDALWFDAKYAALYIGGEDNEGDIIVRDNNGKTRIHLDGQAGDIKLEGADCAEEFFVENHLSVEPGSVMVIGKNDALAECEKAYDKCVAGILSGAGGFKPALILDKRTTVSEKRFPLALSGKVYCKVDADYAAIETGDLLTTSPTKGHGMKAADSSRAFGTVIGKALKPLTNGKGLIPVLVSLQ